jgi:hypothetical protein
MVSNRKIRNLVLLILVVKEGMEIGIKVLVLEKGLRVPKENIKLMMMSQTLVMTSMRMMRAVVTVTCEEGPLMINN